MNDDKTFDSHFNALYKQVFNEISLETGLKEATEKFKGQQRNYLEKLDKYFHLKCKNEFSWIESNSVFKDGKVEPKSGISEEEFELKSNELHQCLMTHDKGLTSPLRDFENEFNCFNGNINKTINECKTKKEDNEIKACIKDKLLIGSNELMKVFEKHQIIFTKINDNIDI